MFRVAAYTGGHAVPSARFRIRQYVAALRGFGVDVHEFPSPLGTYPPANRLVRPLWALGSLGARLPQLARSRYFDLTILQREMLSTFFTLESLTRSPRLLDVDDAIWLHRGGTFARRLAQISDAVICGNAFLADQFSRWNRNVRVLPTAVDTQRFTPKQNQAPQQRVIGWTGTSSSFCFLYQIEDALCSVLHHNDDVKLRIIADKEPAFTRIPRHQLEFVRWRPEVEVTAIQDLTAGIMPLDRSTIARGKCSFKMLTYMACGVPVVASPFGMNAEVLAKGQAGFSAIAASDWIEALQWLIVNPDACRAMGREGRRIVEEFYSVDAITPRLARELHAFIR